MRNSLHLIVILCIAILLFGPASRVRLELDVLYAYYVPSVLLITSVICLHVMKPQFFFRRLSYAWIMALPVLAAGVGFMGGAGQEWTLFMRIIANCAVGAAIILFPWRQQDLHSLSVALIVLSMILSFFAVYTHETAARSYDAILILRQARLPISFFIGLGTLASLYMVFRSLNPIWIGSLVINWIGLVLMVSRGPVIFSALISILYFYFAARSQALQMTKLKKFLLFGLIIGMIPLVYNKIADVKFISVRFLRLFDLKRELSVGRGESWSGAIQSFLDAPLFGHGLGSYFSDGITPHNLFLQYAEDNGIVGLFLVMLFIGISLLCSFRAAKISDHESKNICFMVAGFLVFMLLNMMKSGDSYLSREVYIVTALSIALYCTLVISAIKEFDSSSMGTS